MAINILTPTNFKLGDYGSVMNYNKAKTIVDKKKIFLAGPINGNLEWRNMFISDIQEMSSPVSEINILNPQGNLSKDDFSKPSPLEHNYQILWETFMLELAEIIVFIIPDPIDNIDNYARTTRFELGEWIGKISANMYINKKLFIYINDRFAGKKYIETRCNRLNQDKIQLFDTIKELENRLSQEINY